MDFTITAEQPAILDMARDFASERIAPWSREWERAGTIPRALRAEAAQPGLCGIYVAEDMGVAGLSRLDGTEKRVRDLRVHQILERQRNHATDRQPRITGRTELT